MPASFVYGQVTLNFAIEHREVSVTVKYRYYAQENKVEYESIDCTDGELQETIENDPAVRKKINNYVTTVLARRNEGLS